MVHIWKEIPVHLGKEIKMVKENKTEHKTQRDFFRSQSFRKVFLGRES